VSLAVDLGLVNFLSFTFEIAPADGLVRTAVFEGRPRRLARLCVSVFLLCLLEGEGAFEIGRRVRVRRAADIVSFIFSGAIVAERVGTDGEGIIWDVVWFWA